MPVHMQKRCPGCGESFECKSGLVALCQCRDVALTPVQREYIAAHYDDCLCRACLRQLQQACADQVCGM
ncbi:MAG: cysteine-rich CWC family protein [Gammaproteobacteria bacterium]|jgi:hypothetical protein|nr:cysteine-rich CWC family protein [Gammaproteobacteria bacterium]